ncbi:MAG: anti-sigma factor family protein [Terriglobia bacterium]
MTACRDWNDRLLDYTLGVLDALVVRDLEAHLSACPACAAALVDLRACRAQMDAAIHQLIQGAEPAADFRARVLAAVESPAVSVAGRPAWVGATAAVAVVLLAAVLLSWLGEQPAGPVQESAIAVASLSEWRSPTESLLRTPGDEVLRSVPRLGEFYFPLEFPLATAGEENGGNDDES